MLAYQWQADRGLPVVFLHGLLGSQDDWAEVFALLQNFPNIRPLAVDLPGHGKSGEIEPIDFTTVRQQLHQTLTHCLGSEPFCLVGYSLGGRIALDYFHHQPNRLLQGLLLEGANIGLSDETARQARWQNDQNWADRFENEPLEKVLEAWYQQPVFADLAADKRSKFVKKRQNNHGKQIAKMLRATSLAKQEKFEICSPKIRFLIGEQDHKFRAMATENQLDYRLIAGAGHNAHQANPAAFVAELLAFIGEKNGTTSLPGMSQKNQ